MQQSKQGHNFFRILIWLETYFVGLSYFWCTWIYFVCIQIETSSKMYLICYCFIKFAWCSRRWLLNEDFICKHQRQNVIQGSMIGGLPYTVTPSIDQTLLQFFTLLLIWILLPNLTFYQIARGFHRIFATGVACQQRMLTTLDTWSCLTCMCSNVEASLS